MDAMSFPAYTCTLPIANLLRKTILRLVNKRLCMASWHQLEVGGCDVAARLEVSLKDRVGKSSQGTPLWYISLSWSGKTSKLYSDSW